MLWDPIAATSKTYELKVSTFENGKPEEFLKMMKKFNTAIGGTEATTTAQKTNYIRTLLGGEALRESDQLESQVTGTTNAHLNFIKEGLLGYLY